MKGDRNMNQTELESQYIECVGLMRKTVWDFIKHMRLDPTEFDDLFGQAYLYFVTAADSYNSNLSKFPTWVCNHINKRLLKEFNANKKKIQKIYNVAENITLYTQTPIERLDGLSKDSLRLIVYVRSNELEIDKIIYIVNGRLRKTSGIKHVFRFLLNKNWSRKRIRTCFKNLEQLLIV